MQNIHKTFRFSCAVEKNKNYYIWALMGVPGVEPPMIENLLSITFTKGEFRIEIFKTFSKAGRNMFKNKKITRIEYCGWGFGKRCLSTHGALYRFLPQIFYFVP